MDEPCRHDIGFTPGIRGAGQYGEYSICVRARKGGTGTGAGHGANGKQVEAGDGGNRGGSEKPLYCLQFHPEVYHSIEGKKIIRNFLVNICGCSQDWTPAHFVSDTVASLKQQIGGRKVIMALSGGVDSTVAATLIHRAIGDRLVGIFVDNGVLRKNEFSRCWINSHQQIGFAECEGYRMRSALFYRELAGKTDPEAKRKTIGRLFIDIFQQEANKVDGVELLGQGTIYPDVIESVSVHGPSANDQQIPS